MSCCSYYRGGGPRLVLLRMGGQTDCWKRISAVVPPTCSGGRGDKHLQGALSFHCRAGAAEAQVLQLTPFQIVQEKGLDRNRLIPAYRGDKRDLTA